MEGKLGPVRAAPLAEPIALKRRRPALARVAGVLRRETAALQPRVTLFGWLVQLLPPLTFFAVRGWLYRAAGFRIGKRTLIGGRLHIVGLGKIGRRLQIGSHCFFTTPLFADLSADIIIGDRVTIGHHVVLITADHEIGSSWRRCGAVSPKPIVIGDGVWIAARVTVLPGANIGEGAVIGAGSLVKGSIPPNVLAVGSPARPIRSLTEHGAREAIRAAAVGDEGGPFPR